MQLVVLSVEFVCFVMKTVVLIVVRSFAKQCQPCVTPVEGSVREMLDSPPVPTLTVMAMVPFVSAIVAPAPVPIVAAVLRPVVLLPTCNCEPALIELVTANEPVQVSVLLLAPIAHGTVPLVEPVHVMLPLLPPTLPTVSVVNAPVEGVVPPIAPGAANVAPLREDALRFGTLVVEAMTRGAVPVAWVEVICPVAEIVVNAPVEGAVPPIAGGEAR